MTMIHTAPAHAAKKPTGVNIMIATDSTVWAWLAAEAALSAPADAPHEQVGANLALVHGLERPRLDRAQRGGAGEHECGEHLSLRPVGQV